MTTSSHLDKKEPKFPTKKKVEYVMRGVFRTNIRFYEQNNQLLLAHTINLMEKQLEFNLPLYDEFHKQKLVNSVLQDLGWE